MFDEHINKKQKENKLIDKRVCDLFYSYISDDHKTLVEYKINFIL